MVNEIKSVIISLSSVHLRCQGAKQRRGRSS